MPEIKPIPQYSEEEKKLFMSMPEPTITFTKQNNDTRDVDINLLEDLKRRFLFERKDLRQTPFEWVVENYNLTRKYITTINRDPEDGC